MNGEPVTERARIAGVEAGVAAGLVPSSEALSRPGGDSEGSRCRAGQTKRALLQKARCDLTCFLTTCLTGPTRRPCRCPVFWTSNAARLQPSRVGPPHPASRGPVWRERQEELERRDAVFGATPSTGPRPRLRQSSSDDPSPHDFLDLDDDDPVDGPRRSLDPEDPPRGARYWWRGGRGRLGHLRGRPPAAGPTEARCDDASSSATRSPSRPKSQPDEPESTRAIWLDGRGHKTLHAKLRLLQRRRLVDDPRKSGSLAEIPLSRRLPASPSRPSFCLCFKQDLRQVLALAAVAGGVPRRICYFAPCRQDGDPARPPRRPVDHGHRLFRRTVGSVPPSSLRRSTSRNEQERHPPYSCINYRAP